MCHAIIRVKFTNNETQDVPVLSADEVDNRVEDFKNKDTVQRIEVFTKSRDMRRVSSWETQA